MKRPEHTGSREKSSVAVLAEGTFAVGTDASVIAGLLPGAAADPRVGVGAAGQLVTVFGIAYAVLAPLLAALIGGWSRSRVLLIALALFVLGNAGTAIAPSYPVALAFRVLSAAGAAMFTPTAVATAAALGEAGRRAQAMSVVVSGLTLSAALGVPIGTVLGAVTGWRGTMWFVAGLGVIAAGATSAVACPRRPGRLFTDSENVSRRCATATSCCFC